jgi:hypothetical protein
MLFKLYQWLHNHIRKDKDEIANKGFWGVDLPQKDKEKIYHKDKEE